MYAISEQLMEPLVNFDIKWQVFSWCLESWAKELSLLKLTWSQSRDVLTCKQTLVVDMQSKKPAELLAKFFSDVHSKQQNANRNTFS